MVVAPRLCCGGRWQRRLREQPHRSGRPAHDSWVCSWATPYVLESIFRDEDEAPTAPPPRLGDLDPATFPLPSTLRRYFFFFPTARIAGVRDQQRRVGASAHCIVEITFLALLQVPLLAGVEQGLVPILVS